MKNRKTKYKTTLQGTRLSRNHYHQGHCTHTAPTPTQNKQTHHYQNKLGGRKRVYFGLKLAGHIPSLREDIIRTQGGTLEAGAGAEALEEWLTGLLLHDRPSLLSRGTSDHQPRDSTAYNGLGPLPSVTN